MITARPQKDLKAARSYFRQHLVRGDYYSQERTVLGEWFGQGVKRLGLDLAAPVTEQAFVRLCENRHPLTGDRLTVRHRRQDRRVFYDFTCSAPKSVSILALTAGDGRIVTAHDAACRSAMEALETAAATRVRKGGQRSERTTGEIVAATFRHEESRALDPQLHTHFVVFNATWDAVENRWKALETAALFDQIKLYTEVYRSELALGLGALGYRLRDAEHGFEIEGVSPELIQRYSKRRRAIREEEARLTAKLGKPLSNDARAALAHATRDRKRTDLTPDQLRAYQRAQLSPAEWDRLQQLVHLGSHAHVAEPAGPKADLNQAAGESAQPDPSAPIDPAPRPADAAPRMAADPVAARAAIDYARDHLFERASAVPRDDLLREALQFGRGAVDLPALEAELRSRTEFIEVKDALTTRKALGEEQRLIALVNQGLGGCQPLHPSFQAAAELNAEQRQALDFLLRSPDEVIALRGRAGTGKTRLLQELDRALRERYATAIFAPTAAAVEVLRQQGFTHAATVQRLLVDEDFQQAVRGKALIVDEAGVLSLRDLLALAEITRTQHARLILSGDTRQHAGIEAGDALRLLEEESQLRPVELKNIRRQINLEYRAAIAELAQGQGMRGLRRLERIGAVTQVDDETRYGQVAADYVASLKAGKSALIVSPTWREIRQVTAEVRAKLRQEGLLAEEETTLRVHVGLKWTRAQKRDLRNYRPGHILTFHKATAEFQRGEFGEVTTVLPDRLQVRKTDGTEVSVTRKQAACFEVAREVPLAVAPGERLLIQANRRSDRLFNGQLVTVQSLQPDGAVELTDGRRIRPDFRAFTHGYCVTSHAAQGRAVDHVYVAVDSHTLNAANLKQFYVSASRGREQVRVYTDDREFLAEAVQKPGIRLSATELVQSVRQAARQTTVQRPTQGMRVGM